jgi:hypothetical protein
MLNENQISVDQNTLLIKLGAYYFAKNLFYRIENINKKYKINLDAKKLFAHLPLGHPNISEQDVENAMLIADPSLKYGSYAKPRDQLYNIITILKSQDINIKSGCCYGLSICYSAMNAIGKLEWWQNLLKILAQWDGRFESLDKIITDTELQGQTQQIYKAHLITQLKTLGLPDELLNKVNSLLQSQISKDELFKILPDQFSKGTFRNKVEKLFYPTLDNLYERTLNYVLFNQAYLFFDQVYNFPGSIHIENFSQSNFLTDFFSVLEHDQLTKSDVIRKIKPENVTTIMNFFQLRKI